VGLVKWGVDWGGVGEAPGEEWVKLGIVWWDEAIFLFFCNAGKCLFRPYPHPKHRQVAWSTWMIEMKSIRI